MAGIIATAPKAYVPGQGGTVTIYTPPTPPTPPPTGSLMTDGLGDTFTDGGGNAFTLS